ncbi:MAG: hypothetical protein LBE35_00275 [Clostridiales bacterium]|jgi:hypothetical protein|nr:hypothetical protein [Clostridiales bacterium]
MESGVMLIKAPQALIPADKFLERKLADMESEDRLDMAFCLSMLARHEKRPDKYERGISVEDYAAKWGIDLEAGDDEDED